MCVEEATLVTTLPDFRATELTRFELKIVRHGEVIRKFHV